MHTDTADLNFNFLPEITVELDFKFDLDDKKAYFWPGDDDEGDEEVPHSCAVCTLRSVYCMLTPIAPPPPLAATHTLPSLCRRFLALKWQTRLKMRHPLIRCTTCFPCTGQPLRA